MTIGSQLLLEFVEGNPVVVSALRDRRKFSNIFHN